MQEYDGLSQNNMLTEEINNKMSNFSIPLAGVHNHSSKALKENANTNANAIANADESGTVADTAIVKIAGNSALESHTAGDNTGRETSGGVNTIGVNTGINTRVVGSRKVSHGIVLESNKQS